MTASVFFQALCSFHDFRTLSLVCCFVYWRDKDVIIATRDEFGGITLLYSARWSSPFVLHMGAVFIITKVKAGLPAVMTITAKEKRPAPNRHGSKIKSAASQKNSSVISAPIEIAETVQGEVCTATAPPVCLLPVCSYTRLTAYFGILPTRSPILPERDLTPSSSARGATLAVMENSISRILSGAGTFNRHRNCGGRSIL